ncbi:MAG TPA: hypothetical protein VHK23_00780 [Miltoncostaeaceae bacterium]|nr:hypothetical protein [Miltoncostaeaceae bacterium]
MALPVLVDAAGPVGPTLFRCEPPERDRLAEHLGRLGLRAG